MLELTGTDIEINGYYNCSPTISKAGEDQNVTQTWKMFLKIMSNFP